jgi:predicted GNAT family acetyltransferase
LYARLVELRALQRDTRAAAAAAAVNKAKTEAATAAEKEKTTDAIHTEVEKWLKGKAVDKLLNEITGAKRGDANYLTTTSAEKAVTKVYRRALLKIHPDKHMQDWKQHIRATEMFKGVTTALATFRAKATAAAKVVPPPAAYGNVGKHQRGGAANAHHARGYASNSSHYAREQYTTHNRRGSYNYR